MPKRVRSKGPVPKTILRKVTVGASVCPRLAVRYAEMAEFEARAAYLDDRVKRSLELRQRARALRRLAEEAGAPAQAAD
jgi:hypothetical protein